MRKVILGAVMLSLIGVVDAMEAQDCRNEVLREARRIVAVAVGANSHVDATARVVQEVCRQIFAQTGNRVEAERVMLMLTEMEKALLEKIGYVVGHYGLDPVTSMIGTRSSDILGMDVLKRHAVVSEIYEKRFLPFGGLLPDEDLQIIGEYGLKVQINVALPTHPDAVMGTLPDFSCDWDRGVYGSTHGAWLIRGEAVANWARHWSGGMRVHTLWWNKWGNNSEGSQDNYARAFPEATKRYNAAVATYNQAKVAYDADVKRASDVEFPSVTFDTLVDRVNGYLKKLIK